jgi:hypothetical protein
MNAQTIQPGTRCAATGSGGVRGVGGNLGASDVRNAYQCPNGAVRMVTVQVQTADVVVPGTKRVGRPGKLEDREVPMCEPCAQYHERGAK